MNRMKNIWKIHKSFNLFSFQYVKPINTPIYYFLGKENYPLQTKI